MTIIIAELIIFGNAPQPPLVNPSRPPLKLRGGEGGVMSEGAERELFSYAGE
jgi:hypothetical protein